METMIVDNNIKSESNKSDNEKRKSHIFSSKMSLTLNSNQKIIPDGGYGWIVLFATFLIYAIAEGICFAFGLLFVEFLQEFKASKSATSWIGSLFVALPLVSGPICSALVEKYGCQKMTMISSIFCALGLVLSSYAKSIGVMYLTFGVIGGLSRGVCYITVVVSVTYWFEKRRSLALGISSSGTGFGTIIFAPFTSFLLYEYGWRGTVLILGGCLANMCICGCLMVDPGYIIEEEHQKKINRQRLRQTVNKELEGIDVPLKEEENSTNDKNTTSATGLRKKRWFNPLTDLVQVFSSFSLFLELHFFLLCITTLLTGTWFLIPYFYLVDHMTGTGYSENQASLAISVIGFMNIVGMVLLGWIGDRWNVAKTFAMSLILCGLSIWGIMFFTNNYILLILCSASFGFFFSSLFSLSPSLLSEIVSMDDFTMAFGLVLSFEGSGHLIGPPLAGYITDVSKSWSQSFYQAGLWIIVAGILVGIISTTKNRRLNGKLRSKN